jgi:hypothetical protein
VYEADTGNPDLAYGEDKESNVSDLGQLLIALHMLRTLRPEYAQAVQYVIARENFARFASSSTLWDTTTSGVYRWYVAHGFKFFGFNDEPVRKSLGLLQQILASPTVTTYDVQLPKTDLTSEPLLLAAFNLPTEQGFSELLSKAYMAQENRYLATTKWTGFSEGNALHLRSPCAGGNRPVYVYEWIVTSSGSTWTIGNQPPPPATDPISPIAFVRVGFGFNAIYGRDYAAQLIEHAKMEDSSGHGYLEGIDEYGCYVNEIVDRTQAMVIAAARYALQGPIQLFPPKIGEDGLTVTIDGIALPSTPSATITKINIDWGDGTKEDPWFPVTHKYSQKGAYTVVVTAVQDKALPITGTAEVDLVDVDWAASAMLSASASAVYFIFPDSNAAHPKPPNVGYASVTDWTALGFVYGSLTNMPQITALDTNSTYVDQATGAPKLSNSIIVLFGGTLVNAVVHYYEENRIAPLWWSLEGGWSTGTLYYRTPSGAVAASMPIQTVGGGSADMSLLEAFMDSNGNTVLIFSGFGWKGTFTSGLYFKTVLSQSGNLAGLTDSWYSYSWTDKNGNGFVEDYEVNPTPNNHGN